MAKKEQDGIDKLNALLPGGGASQQEQEEPEPLSEEEVAEKMKEILDLTSKLADEEIFLMQDLLEACTGEIQGKIRDMFFDEGEEGEEGDKNG